MFASITDSAQVEGKREETAILLDPLTDLSLIIHDFRRKILMKIAKKTEIPLETLLEKYASSPITIPVSKTLIVPNVVVPEESIYKLSKADAKKPLKTRGGLEAFSKEIVIPQLDHLHEWSPDTHCHRRTKLGFCLRRQVKRADDCLPKLCGGCMNSYFRQERGVENTDWRGLVTEPFLESTNPKAYHYVCGRSEGNSYLCSDGVRRRCSWFHTRFYRSFWSEETGMVYYDDRTGKATRKMIGDWDRGHPTDQRDPIEISSPDEILDLSETLINLGWTPLGENKLT